MRVLTVAAARVSSEDDRSECTGTPQLSRHHVARGTTLPKEGDHRVCESESESE